MPWINGRFYANPAYGRAVERVRLGKTSGIWTETPDQNEGQHLTDSEHQNSPVKNAIKPAHAEHKRNSADSHNAATTTGGIANQIYNETSGLRPTTTNGPGSDLDMQQARTAIAHVIQNRASATVSGGLPSDEIGTDEAKAIGTIASEAYDAHGESVYAAHKASKQPDPTHGALHYYLDHGQRAPALAKGKDPVAIYGPFVNHAGGGDVPKNKKVRIVVLP